jgi:hypothetical protein
MSFMAVLGRPECRKEGRNVRISGSGFSSVRGKGPSFSPGTRTDSEKKDAFEKVA